MRVFLINRLAFFAILLTSLSLFVFHSRLCINVEPLDITKLATKCAAELKSAIQMKSDHLVVVARTRRHVAPAIHNLERDLEFDEVEKTTRDTLEGEETQRNENGTIEEEEEGTNSTILDMMEDADNSTDMWEEEEIQLLDRHVEEEINNMTEAADEWYKVLVGSDSVTINTRSCFEYDFMRILVSDSSSSPLSAILARLRLPLILMITSLLFAILDCSARVTFVRTPNLIQNLIHSSIQFFIATYVLVSVELLRRNWNSTWQSAQHPAPAYPTSWKVFEGLAFLSALLSLCDVLCHRIANYRVRIEQSEGVYKCVEMTNMSHDRNGTFRSLPDEEEEE